MQNLIIIGAGGYGREVFDWLQDIKDKDWVLAGLIDDNLDALAGFRQPIKVIDTIDNYQPKPNDVFICAIGNPVLKLKFCRLIKQRNGKFINLIHPSAKLSLYSELGEGVVIGPKTTISNDVKVGNFVSFIFGGAIGHDVRIGDGCTICTNAVLGGSAIIDEGAYVGAQAFVMPKKNIGKYSVVGAASAAFRNVPDYTTVLGVPAKVISTGVPSFYS